LTGIELSLAALQQLPDSRHFLAYAGELAGDML
jgi:hypothetical protein